jgi:hypothetical protein
MRLVYNMINVEDYQFNYKYRYRFGVYSKLGSIAIKIGSNLFTIVVITVTFIFVTIAYLDPEMNHYFIIIYGFYILFSLSVYIMASIAVVCVYFVTLISLYFKYRFKQIMENIRIYEKSGK